MVAEYGCGSFVGGVEMSGWVSVKDGMPENLLDVIVWSKGNEPACAYLKNGYWRASGVESERGVDLDGDPEYWHEIPEYPE